MTEYIYGSVPLGNIPEYQLERREEIVRCWDCKHYEPNTYSHFTCELLQFHVEPDGFCAWGERRES